MSLELWTRFVVSGLLILPAASQPANTTIWTGVYTLQQGERGEKAYSRSCSSCHRDDLSGNDDGAPALRESVFFERWKGRRLSEMYFVIAETMPQDAPASLTGTEYVDIISFVLNRNGVPAGTSELSPDMEQLKRILFSERPAPVIR